MRWMTTTPKMVIFSDLDGTLLDRDTYSFEGADEALALIRQEEIPLVLSSSKTRLEMELYRRRLRSDHPFISENGGAVFVPRNYFSFPVSYDREIAGYSVLELGTCYSRILETLEFVKLETGVTIKGFSDLSVEEVSCLCGLGLKEAHLAKRREYDEPFLIEGGERETEIVKEKIEERGMKYSWGGRFHHISGRNDKGKAVQMLKKLYENQGPPVFTVGLGDSLNDLPMLRIVDRAFFLRHENVPLPGSLLRVDTVTIVNGSGAQIWNKVVTGIVKEFEYGEGLNPREPGS